MRKVFVCFMMAVLIFSVIGTITKEEVIAAGNKDNGIKVLVNGEYLKQDAKNGYAQVVNQSVMVPYRAILNQMGVKDSDVSYDKKTKVVRATLNDTTVAFAIGSEDIYIKYADGERDETTTEVPAYADPKVNRTYVSARAMGEAFDFDVDWSSKYKTVIIRDNEMILNQFGDIDKDFSKLGNALNINSPENSKAANQSEFNAIFEIKANPQFVGVAEDEEESDANINFKAKVTGISKEDANSMEGTMKLNIDVDDFIKELENEYEDETEKQKAVESVKMLQNMNIDCKYDIKEGELYITSPELDKIMEMKEDSSIRVVGKTWYKMDLSDMYNQGGIDYTQMLSSVQNGGKVTVSDIISAMMSQIDDLTYVYDEKTETSDVIPLTKGEMQSIYNALKALIGDDGLKKTTENGKDFYSVKVTNIDLIRAFEKNIVSKDVDLNKMLKLVKDLPEMNIDIKYTEYNGKAYNVSIDLKIADKKDNTDLILKADMNKNMQKIKLSAKSDATYFNMDLSQNIREYFGTIDTKVPKTDNVLDISMLYTLFI